MFAKMVSVFGRFSFLDVTYTGSGITTAAASPVNSSGPIKTARDK